MKARTKILWLLSLLLGMDVAFCAAALTPEKIPLCDLQRTAKQGEERFVQVRGVYITGYEGSVLTDAGCPSQSTWVEFDFESTANKEKLRSMLDTTGKADVTFEGEFYGPGLPDPKLPEAIKKLYKPGWGHLGAFRTKLVVHVIKSVRPVPAYEPAGVVNKTGDKITFERARSLVLASLSSKQRHLPSLGVDPYRASDSSKFLFFTVTWEGTLNGSVVVGNYAVDPYTGDVFSATIGCYEEKNKKLEALRAGAGPLSIWPKRSTRSERPKGRSVLIEGFERTADSSAALRNGNAKGNRRLVEIVHSHPSQKARWMGHPSVCG